MQYAEKLNLNVDLTNLSKLEEVTRHEYLRPQKYANYIKKENDATTEVITFRNEDSILQHLPKKLLEIEKPVVSILNIKTPNFDDPIFQIHVDLGRKCAINTYLETNNETTCFHSWDGKTTTQVESFISKNNESWLLDVSKPHSVILKKGIARKILTMSFCKTPYNIVLEHLKNYEN